MSPFEIITTIVKEFPYALFGSVAAGLLIGYLGISVVARRIVFVGAALTQGAVAGIAFAHLPMINMDPALGSLVFTFALVLWFSWMLRSQMLPQDGILGAAFVVAIALRILMIQLSPVGEAAEIDALLKGDLLFVTASQFYIMLGVSAVLLAVHVLLRKEFTFVAFDREMASAQGYPTGLWEIAFYATLGIAIPIAVRIVGDVFVFGFLVLPSLSAMMVARNVRTITMTALAISAAAPVIGFYAAFQFDLPAGPTIVFTLFVFFVAAWVRSLARR
jgi:manganese/iron transport system permease protein